MHKSVKTVVLVLRAVRTLNKMNDYAGVTAYDVARAINISPRLATYHLKRLDAAGSVLSERRYGRKNVAYVVYYHDVMEGV